MIKYALGCENDHEFEGWFSSSDEFSRLQADGHLDCPMCGSTKIQKMLMAPSVRTTKGKEFAAISEDSAEPVAPVAASNPASVPVAVSGPQMPALLPEVQTEIVNQLRDIKKKVLENAENVGENFGEEARKMHYGEKEKRGIYGTTSPDEAVELIEEGVEIVPLPDLPEDKN